MTKKEMIRLDNLDKEFRKIKRIPMFAIPKLEKILHQSPDELLRAVISRKIPFCSVVAESELQQRGVKHET